MTNREKLVELINHVCEHHIENLLQPGGAEALADHLLANGLTVHEWISTKDRLPEKDVEVLVCDRHNSVFIAAVCESESFSTGLSWIDQTGYLIGNLGIVSWQPLPEPTKEEQP